MPPAEIPSQVPIPSEANNGFGFVQTARHAQGQDRLLARLCHLLAAVVLLQHVGQQLSPTWPLTTTTVLALPIVLAVYLAARYLPRPSRRRAAER